jgi:hypothetical protein
MELKNLKFGKEWIDDLNLRPGGATREKWSIFRWESRGEGLCADCIQDLWGPVN